MPVPISGPALINGPPMIFPDVLISVTKKIPMFNALDLGGIENMALFSTD